MDKKRLQWMDISRAFGIFVVLIVHAEIDLGWLSFFGGMFYMPLFFVLAGMNFRYREDESFGSFAAKKAKRLLVPYFGYSLALFVFFFVKDSLLGGDIGASSFFPLVGILYSRYCLFRSDAASNIYFMQILNSPMWFLTCLFVTYIIFWLVMRAAKGGLKKVALADCVLLLAAVLIRYLSPVLLPWSVDTALYAVSFLLLGYAAKACRLPEKLYEKPIRLIPVIIVFAMLSIFNGSVNMSLAMYGSSMVVYLAVGFSGSLIVMTLSMAVERLKGIRVLSRPLSFIGRHTVPILCLHLFVFSVIQTLAGIAGI